MALRSALVDRARVISREPSEVKVEGRTQYAPITREWFRCRVQLPPIPVAPGPGQPGSRRAAKKPSLLFDVKDLNGDPVVVAFQDRIEVRSVEQGMDTVVFELDSDPQPVRKKRRVIAQEVVLRVVDSHTRERP